MADHIQRHFFNGGLLTPQVLTNRYRQLADSVQPAIVAESARGQYVPVGDLVRDVVVEQVAHMLGRRPEEVDPRYRA